MPVTVPRPLARTGLDIIPALFADAGEEAADRFIEFFTATIRNKNTRKAYALAVRRFADWCQRRGYRLATLKPIHIAGYVEELGKSKEQGGPGLAKPTVKQHPAALRMLFDYLVTGQVMRSNPATSVRGPKYVIAKGKTPVLTAEEARLLLDTILPPKATVLVMDAERQALTVKLEDAGKEKTLDIQGIGMPAMTNWTFTNNILAYYGYGWNFTSLNPDAPLSVLTNGQNLYPYLAKDALS
jgi:hypothetical protein